MVELKLSEMCTFFLTFAKVCKYWLNAVFTRFTFQANLSQTWSLFFSKYEQIWSYTRGIFFIFDTDLLLLKMFFRPVYTSMDPKSIVDLLHIETAWKKTIVEKWDNEIR